MRFDPESHRYTVGGAPVPHVTGVLHTAGLIDDRWYSDEVARRGTAVHVGCQLIDEGRLDETTVDPRIVGYLDAWKRFTDEVRPSWMGIEEMLWSGIHRFAGRTDRWGIVGSSLVVVDIKSGGVQRWSRLQTAAYSIALSEKNPTSRFERVVVQLMSDGRYRMHPFDRADKSALRNEMSVFIGALNMVRWMGKERETT